MNMMIIGMWSMMLLLLGLLISEQVMEGGINTPTFMINIINSIKKMFATKVRPFLHEYRVEMGSFFVAMSIISVVTLAVPYLV